MRQNRVYYLGGVDSNQRGAVGTHTSGIISGFKLNGYHTVGVFLDGVSPQEQCDSVVLVSTVGAKNPIVSAVMSRYALIRKIKKIDAQELTYHRFDPFLSPFVVRKNTILEYNDDVVAQVRFAAANGQWSKAGRLIRGFIYPTLFRVSERYCFRKVKAVVAVTKGLRKFVLSVEPNAQAIFVLNGSSASYEPENAKPLKDDEGTLRIGHVGTLTHWDGLIDFLKALNIFKNQNPSASVCFRIVGSGNLETTIIETVDRLGLQEAVTIEPSVSHKEALTILHSIDLVPLLKTIDSYGLSPMKYYEALSLGCFLICSDIDHINEVPEDAGIVVPFPFTPEQIASAIESAHRRLNQIRLDRVARAIRAKEENSWKSRVQELLAETSDLSK